MSIIRVCVALTLVALSIQFARAGEPTTKSADPMDFRKLKEALPAQLVGINRTEAAGEKTAMGEYKVSHAHGSYVADQNNGDAPRIEIDITDYSATKGVADAMAAWTTVEIDREGDNGYEKTTKVGEFPAMETFQNEGKTGTLQVFVAKRYIVQVNTSNLPAEKLKQIGEELKLDKLAALK